MNKDKCDCEGTEIYPCFTCEMKIKNKVMNESKPDNKTWEEKYGLLCLPCLFRLNNDEEFVPCNTEIESIVKGFVSEELANQKKEIIEEIKQKARPAGEYFSYTGLVNIIKSLEE